jgi:hypothetical protein
MKKAMGAVLLLALIAGSPSVARSKPPAASLNKMLKGSYAFSTAGTALVTPTDATNFTPSAAEPPPILTEAGLSGVLVFDGNGNITTDSSVSVALAGVTCPASAYNASNGGSTSGNYTVVSKGPATFAATGKLTLTPGGFNTGGTGTGPYCSQTAISVNLNLVGLISHHSLAIGTSGNGVVGSAALPTSVTASPTTTPATPNPVWDIVTQGSGELQ